MTKIMDYLVDNYIYVAAISGFLIIVLIGFLVKTNKSKKTNKSAKEKSKELEIENKNDENQNVQEKNTSKDFEITPNGVDSGFIKNEEENIIPEINSVVEEATNSMESETKTNVDVSVEEINIIPEIENLSQEKSNSENNNQENDVSLYNESIVEPSNQKFQVVLDDEVSEPTVKEAEKFDLDDTISLNKSLLDDTVDIVDFSELNKFEPNDEVPNSISNNNQ